VKVEPKPEVKKAGGVYYTPTYIVDYIVKNTVGKLIDGKTLKQLANIRVLDPACGSGSFLIVAYQFLLNTYRDEYVKDGTQKHKNEIVPDEVGNWRLTLDEKKKILTRHIYGVDIDTQAVEVTKLSLLLKVLEGESQLKLFHERALPDLGNNIKCGNSLIGPDFYDNQQMFLMDEEDRYRVNVFDWKNGFPEAMKEGGFHAVIGNPPYIGFHGFEKEKEYLGDHFASAKGKFDYYLPFLEKGMRLLRDSGMLGYICPTNFAKRDHGMNLRQYLKANATLVDYVDFQDVKIFRGALNYTGVFVLQNKKPTTDSEFNYRQRSIDAQPLRFKQRDLRDDAWVVRDPRREGLVSKIRECAESTLGQIAECIAEGIVTGQNSVFLLPKEDAKALGLESDLLRPCLRGRNIRRYLVEHPEEVVIYPYVLQGGKTAPLAHEALRKFPKTWAYLSKRRPELSGRGYFESSSKIWYELWCPRSLEHQQARKIVVAELGETGRFGIAGHGLFYGDTVCGITLKTGVSEDLLYVLCLLNSTLIDFYYKATTVSKANNYFIYKTMFLKRIPLRRIDPSSKQDGAIHRTLVSHAERMQALTTELSAIRNDQARRVVEAQIQATDRQIDKLVYELYGLTADEIAIVESPVI
jgi:hypothetical protein